VLIRAALSNKTVREHPIGKIAERTIGYERKQPAGTYDGKGIEAYRKYLNGKDGKILKQKIAKGSGSLFVMLMKWIRKTAMMLYQL
jgi:hypothetical protein